MFAAYKVFQTADRIIKMIQDNVQAVFDPLLASKIIDGQLVTVTFKTANSDTTVNHNLGRPVVAWFPGGGPAGSSSGPTVSASIFLSPSTESKTPNSSIILQASAACTASIWFC